MEKSFGSYHLKLANNSYTDAIKSVVFDVLKEYHLVAGAIDFCLENVETHYLNQGGIFLVLMDGKERVVGTGGLYRLNDQTVELRKMYLLSEHRGKGLGKWLLTTLLDEAKRLGYKRVELETASVLKEAIGLYKKYGFQPFNSDHIATRCDQAYELIL
ncbi:GNAT family N-acetyltransferase [Aureispira anguillae]|uniref:GNAT family N-acetyltransferase n=1 Tax=Aureispira anguillae TaxID=2864201 RepID=A0A915YCW1_9BACT|nr:GNAT family N-acetyltransferase [Aureispira anguillae]BDS10744.1 GNAT family N-acetyltransferase [Aureispira anguillae]